MMKIKNVLLLGLIVVFSLTSCSKSDSIAPTPTPNPKPDPTPVINPVSQFAYDGLSLYYKWADHMKSNKPTTADTDPKKYFKELLYKSDTDHGWSWITDDAEGLLNGFSGKSVSFGYSLTYLATDATKTAYYAFVKYVFPNTPAAKNGIKRLDLITQINGQPITQNNYRQLNGDKAVALTVRRKVEGKFQKYKDIDISPEEINTNPVLFTNVYTIGDKKIGYLFYTGFIGNYNNELYKAFAKFKSENVTDLVLDLRYNRGGAISSASYLASLIAPKTVVESNSTFVKLDYNKFVNDLFDSKGWSRNTKLGKYGEGEQNPLGANLNLNKVYVIDTYGSFSAAELTPFCLKPFMEVVHIGTKTGGKYTASWTITPYREKTITVYDKTKLSSSDKKALGNWAMQPIVAIYADKNGNNFSATDGLLPDYELKEGFGYIDYWVPIGDTKDVLLGQALYLITGDETYKPKKESVVARGYGDEGKKYTTEFEMQDQQGYSESVILDNVNFNQEDLRKAINSVKK